MFPSEIDFMRRCKRRKIYRERSLSPVELEESPERSPSPLHIPTHIHPDSLNREKDYKYKACFLYSLNLEAVTPERRRREYFTS